MTPDFVRQSVDELSLRGGLTESTGFSAVERITHMQPSRRFLVSAGIGFALVVLTYIARIRFSWWMIHPVMFLVWDTWAAGQFYFSFLIGWGIKESVVRLGGAPAFQKTKVLMIGVIIGDLLSGAMWMLVGALYHMITGAKPPGVHVFLSA
jgi:hypothetical protein